MYGRRDEDESNVAFGESSMGLEEGREGFDLAEEGGVREVVVGGGIDEGGGVVGDGSGGGEERECIFGEGERLGGWRERGVWAEAVEGSGMRTVTGVWVDGGGV